MVALTLLSSRTSLSIVKEVSRTLINSSNEKIVMFVTKLYDARICCFFLISILFLFINAFRFDNLVSYLRNIQIWKRINSRYKLSSILQNFNIDWKTILAHQNILKLTQSFSIFPFYDINWGRKWKWLTVALLNKFFLCYWPRCVASFYRINSSNIHTAHLFHF